VSYCRRAAGFLGPEHASDVYVYEHTGGGFYCDDCPRLEHHWEPTALTMAVHLVDDRMWGWVVPQSAIDSLAWEADNQDAVRESAEFMKELATAVPDPTQDTAFTDEYLRVLYPGPHR
jgi:hypothetical protein